MAKINNYLKTDDNQALILIGPRQTGKTSILSLIKDKLTKQNALILSLNAEKSNDILHLDSFSSFISFLKTYNAHNKKAFVFIDELQKMNHPTKLLKLIYDELPLTKIIATGSSSLEIFDRLSEESLAGRKRIFYVYPLSFAEFLLFRYPNIFPQWQNMEKTKTTQIILPEIVSAWHDFAVCGGYPRPSLAMEQEIRIEELEEIYNSYLQKDIAGILRKDEKAAFAKFVILLSAQNGQLLNINELSNTLSLARSTIQRFIFILQETFIIKLINPYFTNKRKEITKMPKIYFIDAGMRNFVKRDFSDLDLRPDNGQLIENFVLTELLKHSQVWHEFFFWRTPSGSETDFIIKRNQDLFPVEVKYQTFKKPIVPSGMKAFINLYKPKQGFVLTKNFYSQTEYKGAEITFLPAFLAVKIFQYINAE